MSDIPLSSSKIQLDTSGLVGFFGGDEALSAMATVNVYKGRRWLGWYNSPGSYIVARKYGQLADTWVWNALFPGVTVSPAALFGFDGSDGPQFMATQSGSQIHNTGQTGRLFLEECRCLISRKVNVEDGSGSRRKTTPYTVTIANLSNATDVAESIDVTQPLGWVSCLVACFTILSSTTACIICGFYRDWFSFSTILVGIVCNGVFSVVLGGSTSFQFLHPKPANGSPEGDGILFFPTGTDADIAVLHGHEGVVNLITRGKLNLEFPGAPGYNQIGIASALLIVQALTQLLVIPQGTLFGQVMFLSTLAVSWLYSCYLSSRHRDQILREILRKTVLNMPESHPPGFTKCSFGTRTQMVTFLLLHLEPHIPAGLLETLLPETETWKKWKKVVLDKVMNKGSFSLKSGDGDMKGVKDQEKALLRSLYEDAEYAFGVFNEFREDTDKTATSMHSVVSSLYNR